MQVIEAAKPTLYLTATQTDAAKLKLRGFDAEKVDASTDVNSALIHYSQHDIYLTPTDSTRADFASLAARLVSLGNTVYVAPVDADAATITIDQCKRILAPDPAEKRVRGPAAGGASESMREMWRTLGLEVAHNGQPFDNIDNAQRAIAASGIDIWYDTFLHRSMTAWNTDEREFRDSDYIDLTIWMQRDLQLRRMSLRTVTAAADAFMRANTKNCAQTWMQSLVWDNVDRLNMVAARGFGAPDDDYHAAVLRCFIMGMVKRVLSPGCQVDNVPVFEGPEGRRKSSALRLLGGKWFAECHEEITGKDFMQIMPGKMLLEVAELHSFRRAELERVKGIITNRVDRYRASYARTAEDHPRQCVMAGTTNRDDWNSSDTGARRFWPVACGVIDLDWLAENRRQLFAEAVYRVQRGEPHWDVPADAAAEQVALRKAGDAWDGLIGRYCDARKETTVEEVMRDCLEIDKARATNADAARIRSVLRDFGWRNTGPGTVMWHGGKAVRKWVRPGYAEQRLDEIRAPAVQPTTPDPVTDNNPFDPDCPF